LPLLQQPVGAPPPSYCPHNIAAAAVAGVGGVDVAAAAVVFQVEASEAHASLPAWQEAALLERHRRHWLRRQLEGVVAGRLALPFQLEAPCREEGR